MVEPGTVAAIRLDMRNLRRTLASIALAAPLAGCLPGSCPKVAPTDDTIAIGAMPDATLAQLVADCKATQNCTQLCDEVYSRKYTGSYPIIDVCELTTDPATGGDAVHVVATRECVGGRRPTGYRKGRPCGHVVASYLAQQAELEAASVRAFSDLLDDLVAHGAPIALRRAMVSAAADEVRHARTCSALARRHGMTPRFAPVAAGSRRTRGQLAIDNAVEGCVRETYGAVVAGYQGRAASDPAIRRAMAAIARDEAKHAALSWQLHAWLWSRLDATERAAVTAAMREARAELVVAEEAPELHAVAGLPDRTAATAMLAELDQTVWAAI
jgi:hypothetical protein